MDFEKFINGNHFSIGLELELRILDKYDLTLQNEYDYIYSNIKKEYQKNLAPEFLASMIEINTPIFHDEKDLINYLKEIIQELNKVASNKNLVLQTSGTYAQENKNIQINSNKRYEELYEEHKILLDNFSICGTHIHIGFEDFDKALRAYNYAIFYLPIFIALSASSIFFNNINSGIHSYRTKIFDRLPKASLPEYFDSYEQMKELYDILEDANVIKSIKDIWWDVRIQPHFKTLEFRICDAINDFDKMQLIVSLIKAVCKLSQIEELHKVPMQILKQNMWSATRYSMDAVMISNSKVVTIRNIINDLLIRAKNSDILSKEFCEYAKQIVEKNSISYEMEKIYNRTNSLKEVDMLGVFK